MNAVRWSVVLSCVLSLLCCRAQEFLYPVGTVLQDQKEKVSVLYQNNSHLELWFWDPETLQATKGLLSSFTPAGMRSLPSKHAFSFIDHDRIRVKDLTKRSPKAIDLPYGPYDLSTIEWINDSSFYFSARERAHFNLFHGTVDGELYRLTNSSNNDYMYPQKLEDALFYIVRYEDGTGAIEQVAYPVTEIAQISQTYQNRTLEEEYKEPLEEQKRARKYLDFESKKTLYKSPTPRIELAFLKMVNQKQGYFLTHPTFIERSDTHMTFECYRLTWREKVWHSKALFAFSIPLYLLLPQYTKGQRLYESIFPLLPSYQNGIIYYSHDSGTGLDLYAYNEQEASTKRLINSSDDHHFFPPLSYKDKRYYGGTVCHGDGLAHCCPQMWINEQGEQRFIFPNIETCS